MPTNRINFTNALSLLGLGAVAYLAWSLAPGNRSSRKQESAKKPVPNLETSAGMTTNGPIEKLGNDPSGFKLAPGDNKNLTTAQLKFLEMIKSNVVILNERPVPAEKIRFIWEASTSLLKGLSLDTDTQLLMYAYYKQIKVGDCSGSRPGILDFVGQKKYDAWAKVKGMPAGNCMIEYMNLVLKRLGPIQQGLVDKFKQANGEEIGGVQSLLQKDKDHDKVFSDLFGIVEQGDLKLLVAALKKGADPFERNDMDETILHFAADRGHLPICEFLLQDEKYRGLANMKDDMGCTPLHLAAVAGSSDVVELLLKSGADSSIKNEDGKTAFDEADADVKALLKRASGSPGT